MSQRVRQVACWGLLLVCGLLPVVAPSGHAAESQSTRIERDGVILDIESSQTGVAFCLSTNPGHKISAGYGVEVSVSEQDAGLWNDRMPKIVANDDELYFLLPILISISAKGNMNGHQVYFDLGVCSQNEFCRRVAFTVTVPARSATRNDTFNCADSRSSS
jgi:hypothetical protein